MSRGMSVSLVIGLLAGIALGGLVMLALTTTIFFHEPSKILSADGEGAFIRQNGGVLEVNYKVFRRQVCNSSATVWLWKWIDADDTHPRRPYVVQLRVSVIPWPDVSPLVQEFVIADALPRQVTPGDWYLRIRYLDYCAFLADVFGPRTRQAADIPITIAPFAYGPSSL